MKILCLREEITIKRTPSVCFPAFRLPAPLLRIYLSITNVQAALPQKKSSPSSLEILQIALKTLSSEFSVVKSARSKFSKKPPESKLNSDSSDEKEMILKQNLDVLVSKYIGKISFLFHFLEHSNTESRVRRHCVWFLGRRY